MHRIAGHFWSAAARRLFEKLGVSGGVPLAAQKICFEDSRRNFVLTCF